MSSFNYTSCLTQVKSSTIREHIPLHGSETLLCIEVYHNRRGTWFKTPEILVLGQQLLTELRDKIYCLTDQIMKLATKDDPSGYFLIEVICYLNLLLCCPKSDIFYNDSRDACATDYSKPLLDWLRESKDTALEKWKCIISGDLQQKHKEFIGSASGPKLPPLKARPMQATRYCDLNFHLGAGYLYCHQFIAAEGGLHVWKCGSNKALSKESMDPKMKDSPIVTWFRERLRFESEIWRSGFHIG